MANQPAYTPVRQQPGRPLGASGQALAQGFDFYTVGAIEVMGHGVAQIGDQSPSVQRRQSFLADYFVRCLLKTSLLAVQATRSPPDTPSGLNRPASGSLQNVRFCLPPAAGMQLLGFLVHALFIGGFRRFSSCRLLNHAFVVVLLSLLTDRRGSGLPYRPGARSFIMCAPDRSPRCPTQYAASRWLLMNRLASLPFVSMKAVRDAQLLSPAGATTRSLAR